MSEEMIVQYCSPTLAGLKTGNLFSCVVRDELELKEIVRSWNRILVKKGLRVMPLRCRDNRALIYIYRPARLRRDLQDCRACQLLTERGYTCENADRCVIQLMRRLAEKEEFPHEIGLFLSYPPEDVCGFIENHAEGCKFVGHWKVYGDVESAKKTFDKYNKCTRIYCEEFAKGRTIERLTVAG